MLNSGAAEVLGSGGLLDPYPPDFAGIKMRAESITCAHWEELLKSVSDFIFSKHCGYRSRGVRGVKRPEIL